MDSSRAGGEPKNGPSTAASGGSGVKKANGHGSASVTPQSRRGGAPDVGAADSPYLTPKRASRAQQLAFKEHLPNTYIHTCSVEAVLAPIAQQLSNLIMIVARAERAGKAIRDLSPYAVSITKACHNLVSVGHASMAEGDEQLRTTMPHSCRELSEASHTFSKATETLAADPMSAAGRDLLVEAVRSMLSGTTNILANYDGFEVRKMVRMGNNLLGQLAVAQQHASGGRPNSPDDIDLVVATIKEETAELGTNVEQRAGELRNVSHSARLTRAVSRMQTTAPLVMVSLRTVSRLSVSKRAREGFDFAVDEMQRDISEIVTVLNFTAIDDNTYEEKGGTIATVLEDVEDELLTTPDDLQIERLESQVLMAVAESARAARKFQTDSRIETVMDDLDILINEDETEGGDDADERARVLRVARNKLATGALSDDEVGHILHTEFKATGEEEESAAAEKTSRVHEACESLRTLLADLKADPSEERIAAVADELQRLESSYRAASVEEMTAALLSDEHAADLLVQASETGDVAALKAQVVQFRRHTSRVTSAAQLVSKVSRDAKRVSFVESTAEHLTTVSDQLVNVSLLTVEAPGDRDVRRQQDLLRRSYHEDLGLLKNSVNEMVDTQVVINADYDFVEGMASTAIKAAEQGYAAAARAAVRKMRKRVGHVITVAASEMDNTVDATYKAAIDAILFRIEDVDPKLGDATKRLGRNPNDQDLVREFSDTCNGLVHAVRDLRQCMEGSTQAVPEAPVDQEEAALLLQAAAEEDARDAEDDAVFEVTVSPPVDAPSPTKVTTVEDAASPKTPTNAASTEDAMAFAMSVADTPGAPVVRAAVKLRREANKWSEVKNPIVLHAKRMATHMANMGHITGRKEMGEMIESAQAIVAEGNELTKTALNLASRCSDKRLKEDIASLCNRINTIGVQLKIVASVKATCGDGDSAQSDAMMHNSASNLMDAAQHLVRACEASSLKLLPVKPDTPKLDIIWRKRKAGLRTSTLFKRFGAGTPI